MREGSITQKPDRTLSACGKKTANEIKRHLFGSFEPWNVILYEFNGLKFNLN